MAELFDAAHPARDDHSPWSARTRRRATGPSRRSAAASNGLEGHDRRAARIIVASKFEPYIKPYIMRPFRFVKGPSRANARSLSKEGRGSKDAWACQTRSLALDWCFALTGLGGAEYRVTGCSPAAAMVACRPRTALAHSPSTATPWSGSGPASTPLRGPHRLNDSINVAPRTPSLRRHVSTSGG
jgi:hypothetical protein